MNLFSIFSLLFLLFLGLSVSFALFLVVCLLVCLLILKVGTCLRAWFRFYVFCLYAVAVILDFKKKIFCFVCSR